MRQPKEPLGTRVRDLFLRGLWFDDRPLWINLLVLVGITAFLVALLLLANQDRSVQ